MSTTVYDSLTRWLMNLIGGPHTDAANAGMQGLTRANNTLENVRMCRGTVIQCDSSSYSVRVRCDGGTDVACVMAGTLSTPYFGANEAFIPTPGTQVLVLRTTGDTYGVIVACLPAVNCSKPNASVSAYPHGIATSFETAATPLTEPALSAAAKNEKDVLVQAAQMTRPMDLFPGDHFVSNEYGCCIGLGALGTYVKAGEGAKLEMNMLDNVVRLVSGHYQHHNALGIEETYCDGGFSTTQLRGSMYHCEKLGERQFGVPVYAEGESTGKTGYLKDGMTSVYTNKKTSMLSRINSFLGYLGDIFNFFVTSPRADGKSDGLFHAHVDSDGHLSVRAASGVSLQRSDCIPVPEQLRRPEDPAGTKREDDAFTPSVKLNTEKLSGTPLNEARALLLRDIDAMRFKNSYLRFLEAVKDYVVPEAEAVSTPTDEYDAVSKSSTNFQTVKNRRSFINLEPDGSIVIRDAFGAEIVMANGNITFNCPGDIRLASGNSTVVLAGHDAIIKGRQSVDITATEHDVRIKAENNLQAVGKGVLLESTAVGGLNGYVGRTGEQVAASGVVLKATESRVLLAGSTVHAAATSQVILETPSTPDNAQGVVTVVTPRLVAAAVDGINLSVGDSTLFAVDRYSLKGYANAIGFNSSGALDLVESRDQHWSPAALSAGVDAYSAGERIADDTSITYFSSNAWLGGYTADAIKDVKFTFRSPAEYGTVSGSFKLYQSAWSFMASKGELFGMTVEGWEERPIAETYPWPGAAAYQSGASVYYRLDKESNVKDGKPVAFKDINDNAATGATLLPKSFSEYEVRTHS